MHKINFKERIVMLIANNYSNQQIKIVIYDEYGIKLSFDDIRIKRNSKFTSESKNETKDNNGFMIKLVKDILIKNISKPLTKNEIVELIFTNNNIVIKPIDVKNILREDLKNEIKYDSINWTYILKTNMKSKNDDLFDLSKINGNKPNSDSIYKIIENKKEPLSYKSSSKILYHINDLVLQELYIFKNSNFVNNKIISQPVKNLKIDELLNYFVPKITFDKPLGVEEKNKYMIDGCVANKLFLNELKLILECFNEKKTKLYQGEIMNYLKIKRKEELNTIDLNKLLLYNLSFLLEKESIYFKVIDNLKLNDFLNVVSKEILFYDLYIESVLNKNMPVNNKNLNKKNNPFLKNKILKDIINETIIIETNNDNDEEIDNVKTLNEHLKEEIDLIIRKLFGRIKFNQTQILDAYLYKMELDFNFNKEQKHKALYNIVNSNYLFLEKLYFLIQNFSNNQMFKDELIENNEKKILETDIDLFLEIFNSLFIIDENIIIVKNELLFNQTKDELEFLYEAYEKYYLNLKNQVVETIIDDKSNETDYTYSIDGYSIFVIIVNIELAPLYWCKTEGLKQYIYFNKTHPKSSVFPESSFVQILIALGRTSLSFSDNSGELFFNRMKNYLDLI